MSEMALPPPVPLPLRDNNSDGAVVCYPDDETSRTLQTEELKKELTTLWRWNVGCGCLHLFQAIAALAAGTGVERMKAFKLPVTTQFLVWSNTTVNGTMRLPKQSNVTQGMIPFVAVTSGFAFLSALAHLIVISKWDVYTSQLARGQNRFRWFEYSISSSLMIVLIAMLFGVYDLFVLICLGMVNACMCLFGDLHETINMHRAPRDVDWSAYIYGTVAGIIPWAVIIAYLSATPNLDLVPGFVWAILIAYFTLFQTFPITMWLQYTQRGPCDNAKYPGLVNGGYYAGERIYCTLSLVAKSVLLWLVVGGSNQPNAGTTG